MDVNTDTLDRELRRVVDRLNSLNPQRVDPLIKMIRVEVQKLADLAAKAEGLAYRAVPDIDSRAAGAQLNVLVRDLVRHGDQEQVDAGTELLVRLRRSLP